MSSTHVHILHFFTFITRTVFYTVARVLLSFLLCRGARGFSMSLFYAFFVHITIHKVCSRCIHSVWSMFEIEYVRVYSTFSATTKSNTTTTAMAMKKATTTTNDTTRWKGSIALTFRYTWRKIVVVCKCVYFTEIPNRHACGERENEARFSFMYMYLDTITALPWTKQGMNKRPNKTKYAQVMTNDSLLSIHLRTSISQ